MKAILRNKVTGETIPVTSTTDHPDSSYGQPVWVDEKGQSFCVCGVPSPFYDVIEMEVEGREELGAYIRLMRVTNGVSVRGLAEDCGLSPATVQNIEKGAFSPRLDIVGKILDRLGAKMVIKQ